MYLSGERRKECTAPQTKPWVPQGTVIIYCADAKDMLKLDSGNFVKIKKVNPTELYLSLVKTNVCIREDSRSVLVGKECSCSGLLGKILGQDEMKTATTLTLSFTAKPFDKGCG